MKKLFALIGLLVLGMGGMLNAQEEAGDTQSTLDTIVLYGDFPQDDNSHTVSFKFSATPDEKFVIRWGDYYLKMADTILVENANEMEMTYTYSKEYSSSRPHFFIIFHALAPTGHIKSLRIDSTYKYSELTCKNCMLLDTIQVAHNDLNEIAVRNCPALSFLDFSYNKIGSWSFWPNTNWYDNLTYLNCSHNNIGVFTATKCIALKTLDVSYNRDLRYLTLSDCLSLTDLTVRCNDTLETLDVSNLPLQHLTCTENQKLSRINADNCRFQALDVSGNPALEILECNDNQLTALTFNDCPALISISCSHNQLTSITFNEHSALTTINCDYNKLDYIDLSQCKNLQDLYISNNRFSTLEIPDNMILHNLYCDSNHIPLSILADLSKHVINGLTSSSQFPTAPILQVGEFLDLQSETHLNDCEFCEHYTIFLDGQPIEERWSDGAEDHDYGLFAFPQAGIYRLQLYSRGAKWNSSVYYDLTVVDSVVRPQFSIPSGAVLPDTELVLSTPTPDARIYYTTDGAEPDENSLLYQEPIRITETMTIRAVAVYKTVQSQIATATYTMDTVARPTFSIPSGTVKIGTTVSLSTTTPNASIIYTTDGTEPGNNALEYTEPIRITEAMTIKAVTVYKTLKSQVASATYTIDSVANESDLKTTKLRIYAKDQTIYLSEEVGEVEVFTIDGHCVYRGFDTAIPVKQNGIYIVAAAGRRGKVAVR